MENETKGWLSMLLIKAKYWRRQATHARDERARKTFLSLMLRYHRLIEQISTYRIPIIIRPNTRPGAESDRRTNGSIGGK